MAQALEQMNERRGGIEGDIAGLRQEMSQMRSEIHREMLTNFRWTMGTLIAAWVTIICAIMFA